MARDHAGRVRPAGSRQGQLIKTCSQAKVRRFLAAAPSGPMAGYARQKRTQDEALLLQTSHSFFDYRDN